MIIYDDQGNRVPAEAPTTIVVPETSVPRNLWKRSAVLGILRNILPGGADTTVHRQLNDIDTTRQRDESSDIQGNPRFNLAISETNPFVVIWETFIFLACLYNLIAVPLPAFDDIFLYHFDGWIKCNFVADGFYIADIIFKCFTSIYQEGLKVRNVFAIGSSYAKTPEFILDLFSVVPIDLLVFEYRALHILRINRLAKCYRIFFYLSRIQMHAPCPNMIVMSKVIIPIICIFHWNACGYFALSLFYGIDDSETNNWPFAFSKIFDPIFSDCNWLPWTMDCQFDETPLNGTKETYVEEMQYYWADKSIPLNFSDLSKKYVLSFYWSSLTITTLGEQPEPDFSPQNMYEIMDTVIGILIFGAIMGSVAEIVQNANRYNRELRSGMDMAKIFMLNRRVEESVQRRVFGYFEYAIATQWFYDDPTDDRSLTTALRQEIRSSILLPYLRKIELFKDVTEVFLKELIAHFRTQLYSPNDFVCSEGDICRELFIVETGCIVELREKEKGIIRKLRKGSYFGELSLIYVPEHRFEDRRHTSLLAAGFSEVHVLNVQDFRRILKDFPEVSRQLEMETRKSLRDQGLLRTDEEMMEVRYREQAYHDVEDRLSQIKKQVAILNFGIKNHTHMVKKHHQNLHTALCHVENRFKQAQQVTSKSIQ